MRMRVRGTWQTKWWRDDIDVCINMYWWPRNTLIHKYVTSKLKLIYKYGTSKLWVSYKYVTNLLQLICKYVASKLWVRYKYVLSKLWVSHKYVTSKLQVFCNPQQWNKFSKMALLFERMQSVGRSASTPTPTIPNTKPKQPVPIYPTYLGSCIFL